MPDLFPEAVGKLGYADNLIERGLVRVKRLPLQEYIAHIMAAWGWCADEDCFGGMAATGPNEGNPIQVAAFEKKRLACLNILATLAIASGKWNRLIQQRIQEPILNAPCSIVWIPGPHCAAHSAAPAHPALPAHPAAPAHPVADVFFDSEELEEPGR